MEAKIKVTEWPERDETDIEAVVAILRSGKWGSPDLGGAIKTFDEEFAAYNGSRFAASVVNGSVALRVALLALGVKPGDEVIVPPYTFFATASIVAETNCVPVFADIEPGTYNLDPVAVEAAITPRTRAIIPVHFAGAAANMEAFQRLAARHGLVVIEDACHGHGGEYRGRKLGSLADAGCFSFQSSKNMTSGEGGAVITDREDAFDMVNSLRNCGRVKGGQWYEHHHLGCNYRITQLQAALLSAQLKRLEGQTRRRHDNGLYLDSLIEKVEGMRPMDPVPGQNLHPRHIYMFRYNPGACGGTSKVEFARRLAEKGVPCFRGYPEPLYRQPVFRNSSFLSYDQARRVDYTRVHCPVAEKACHEEAVWIYQNFLLGSREDMEAAAAAVGSVAKALREEAARKK